MLIILMIDAFVFHFSYEFLCVIARDWDKLKIWSWWESFKSFEFLDNGGVQTGTPQDMYNFQGSYSDICWPYTND